jgi:hypothetical protein
MISTLKLILASALYAECHLCQQEDTVSFLQLGTAFQPAPENWRQALTKPARSKTTSGGFGAPPGKAANLGFGVPAEVPQLLAVKSSVDAVDEQTPIGADPAVNAPIGPPGGSPATDTVVHIAEAYDAAKKADDSRMGGPTYGAEEIRRAAQRFQKVAKDSYTNLPAITVVSDALSRNQDIPPSVIAGAITGSGSPMAMQAAINQELEREGHPDMPPGTFGPPIDASDPNFATDMNHVWGNTNKFLLGASTFGAGTGASDAVLRGKDPHKGVWTPIQSDVPTDMFPVQPIRPPPDEREKHIDEQAYISITKTMLEGYLASLPTKAANIGLPKGCSELHNKDLAKGQGNGHYWRCLDGQCIEYAGRCDGRPNCHDGSDELYCNRQLFGRVNKMEKLHTNLRNDVDGMKGGAIARVAEFNDLNKLVNKLNSSIKSDFNAIENRLGPYLFLAKDLDTIIQNHTNLTEHFRDFEAHDEERVKDAEMLIEKNGELEKSIASLNETNAALKQQVDALKQDYVDLQIQHAANR